MRIEKCMSRCVPLVHRENVKMQKILLLYVLLFVWVFAEKSIPLKEACNQENNATACYLYALPLVQGDNAKVQDLKEEGNLYMRKGCSLMNDNACTYLGENYYTEKRYRAAMPYLEQSCVHNIDDACSALGTIYRDGHDTRIDDIKSREYYEKACMLKSADACYAVALVYRAGFGVDKNRTQEKNFYKKACDNNLKVGCDRFTELDNEDKGIKTSMWDRIKSWF